MHVIQLCEYKDQWASWKTIENMCVRTSIVVLSLVIEIYVTAHIRLILLITCSVLRMKSTILQDWSCLQ